MGQLTSTTTAVGAENVKTPKFKQSIAGGKRREKDDAGGWYGYHIGLISRKTQFDSETLQPKYVLNVERVRATRIGATIKLHKIIG